MEQLKIDEVLSNILPGLSDGERNCLEKSLYDNGYKGNPIITWSGVIVDGHERYRICKRLGIEFSSVEMDFANQQEAIRWIITTHLSRRHMTTGQKVQVAMQLREAFEEEAKEAQREAGRQHGRGQMRIVIEPDTSKKTRHSKGNKACDSNDLSEIGELLEDASGEEDDQKEYFDDSDEEQDTENFSQAKSRNKTVSERLAELAGVSRPTFCHCEEILRSNCEEAKEDLLANNESVSGCYRKFQYWKEHAVYVSPIIDSKRQAVQQQEDLKNARDDISKCLKVVQWFMQQEYTNDDGESITDDTRSKLLEYNQMLKEMAEVTCRMKNNSETGIIQITG